MESMRHLKKELWPFQIKIYTLKDVTDWCNTSIGKRSKDWYEYSENNTRVFAFKDEASLLAFKITWGGT